MSDTQIQVNQLNKVFRVPVRSPGLGAAAKSLFRPKFQEVVAVDRLDFSIRAGEVVGLIGPNGAGKTTTLKMLCGLLHPTSGEALVAGFTPADRKPAYLRKISMVMGNKSQMLWDIPPLDSFNVLAEIYALQTDQYHQTLDELVDLLDMQALLHKPVRNLSLGERMKCELVAGLLHRPAILFLDEPTLGLDITMQGRLRRFLREYNLRSGVTIILTSHYMADVVALCPRVILIHQGKLLYDGKLEALAEQLAPFKLIRMSIANGGKRSVESLELPEEVDIVTNESSRITLRVRRDQAARVTAHLLQTLPVADLAVEDPPIEAVIDQIYTEERGA